MHGVDGAQELLHGDTCAHTSTVGSPFPWLTSTNTKAYTPDVCLGMHGDGTGALAIMSALASPTCATGLPLTRGGDGKLSLPAGSPDSFSSYPCYAASKLANIYFGKWLAEREKGAGVSHGVFEACSPSLLWNECFLPPSSMFSSTVFLDPTTLPSALLL